MFFIANLILKGSGNGMILLLNFKLKRLARLLHGQGHNLIVLAEKKVRPR
ncbi:nicotinate-nucleotide pyrophosphorylase [Vibrio splendidus]|nr:nicotinate-nucleotide pyrophosphorylase [Vibrio splendidus]